MFITINNSQDQLYNAMFISHFKKDIENLEIHYFLQNGTKISEKFEDETSLNSKFDLVTNIKFGGASGGGSGTGLSNIYSTEEQVIGTWIDGSNVYRKAVSFTTGASANDLGIPHGISNFKHIINVYGFTHRESDHECRPIPNFYRTSENRLYGLAVYAVTPGEFVLTYGSYRTNMSGYVILEYVKTTDE